MNDPVDEVLVLLLRVVVTRIGAPFVLVRFLILTKIFFLLLLIVVFGFFGG